MARVVQLDSGDALPIPYAPQIEGLIVVAKAAPMGSIDEFITSV